MSEMHVLEAVDKESSPSMSAVANHLNVTLGTLTTAGNSLTSISHSPICSINFCFISKAKPSLKTCSIAKT